MTRPVTRDEIMDALHGIAGSVPVALEWRPLGGMPEQAQLEEQWQRERGFAFWLAQYRRTVGHRTVRPRAGG